MEYKLAKLISFLLHPLFMPLLSIYSLINASSYFTFRIHEKVIYIVYLTVFVFTLILPALSTMILFKFDLLNKFESPDKNDRKLPYLITAIYYTSAYYLLNKIPLPSVILLSLMGATLIIIIASVINLFWKISAHMIGIGGLVGSLLALTFKYMVDTDPYLTLSIMGAGLLGFSRLKLNAHTPMQVYGGFLLACFIQFLIVYFG
jgi:hypothetical protein